MKKILLTIVTLFCAGILMAQPRQRPLPNQFRDYVDFRMSLEKPEIIKKDGNVMIIMSEELFEKTRNQMGFSNYSFIRRRNSPPCDKCIKKHKKHSKTKKRH